MAFRGVFTTKKKEEQKKNVKPLQHRQPDHTIVNPFWRWFFKKKMSTKQQILLNKEVDVALNLP